MTKIDVEKVFIDESRSNPMVAAMVYPMCPIGAVCMYMAVGGAVIDKCENLMPEGEGASCLHSVACGAND